MINLEKKRNQLIKQLTECTNMIRGSITSVCSSCNRANCICTTPTKAKAYRLTYKDIDQKTKTIYVRKEKLREAKKRISNFKQCKKIIDQLILSFRRFFLEFFRIIQLSSIASNPIPSCREDVEFFAGFCLDGCDLYIM